jgi:hypothetical protein
MYSRHDSGKKVDKKDIELIIHRISDQNYAVDKDAIHITIHKNSEQSDKTLHNRKNASIQNSANISIDELNEDSRYNDDDQNTNTDAPETKL